MTPALLSLIREAARKRGVPLGDCQVTLKTLTNVELCERLNEIKTRAVYDSIMIEMEFCVGDIEHDKAANERSDTEEVIDEVIRRLKEGK